MVLFRKKKAFVFVTLLALSFCSPALYAQQDEVEFFSLPEETETTNALPAEKRHANPYLLPLTFDGKIPIDLDIEPIPQLETRQLFPTLKETTLPESERKAIDKLRKKAYQSAIRHRIDLVRYTYHDFEQPVEKVTELEQKNVFQRFFEVDNNVTPTTLSTPESVKPKRRYWRFNGSSTLEFKNSYISENWYKGGIGNVNLLSDQIFRANYAKNKVTFNNEFRWRLSFYTHPDDTIRSFIKGDDAFRYYGTFGYQAFNAKWHYTFSSEVKTQILRTYPMNSEKYRTAFASPLNINPGVGMSYTLRNKNITYTKQKNPKRDENGYTIPGQYDVVRTPGIRLAELVIEGQPFSANYIWIEDKSVYQQNRHGIEEGEYYSFKFGSTINLRYTIIFSKTLNWTSRMKYFSDYERVEAEWENTFRLNITKLLSATLYCYTRFDDRKDAKRDPYWGKVQMNEYLSLGLTYSYDW